MALVSVLVTGSTAYDILLGYDGSFADAIDQSALEELSVSFFVPHHQKRHGGTAPNIAWGIALLGGSPTMVSTIGGDAHSYAALLKDNGVDVSHLEILEEEVTATATIGTDTSQRQITFFHPGADANGSLPDLSAKAGEFSYAIISPRNAVLMMQAVHFCKDNGVKYIFDPGQQTIALGDDELRFGIENSFGVVANEYEWGLISDRLNMTEENACMQTDLLIVTRGSAGITCFSQDGARTVAPCVADSVVNPTGAGDAFRAGLLRGLDAGWNSTDCLRLGSAMGSFAVEIPGTLIEHATKEDIADRAEKTYSETLPSL